MSKITAIGKLFGEKIKVECEKTNGEIIISVNGEEDEFVEEYIETLLSKRYPVGGSYCPPENSMLNVWNVLKYRFFDELISIEVEGEIEEIPFEKGKIY